MNSAGLVAYDGSSNPVLSFTTADSALTVKGSIQAGSTIAGARITGTLETEATANRGVKMTSAGMTFYDVAGTPVLTLTSGGTGNAALAVTGTMSGSTISTTTLTGGTVQTESTADRGIKINSAGLTAYDGSGNPTVTITAAGAATFKGTLQSGSSITGAVINGPLETSTSASTGVKITNSGIYGYGGGVEKFSLTTAGVVSITSGTLTSPVVNTPYLTGGTIQTEDTVDRGIKMNSAGITGYDTSGNPKFVLTAAGTLTMNGGTITGGIFQTAPSGARAYLDSTGFHGTDGTTEKVNFGNNGTFLLRSAASGARIEFDNAGLRTYSATENLVTIAASTGWISAKELRTRTGAGRRVVIKDDDTIDAQVQLHTDTSGGPGFLYATDSTGNQRTILTSPAVNGLMSAMVELETVGLLAAIAMRGNTDIEGTLNVQGTLTSTGAITGTSINVGGRAVGGIDFASPSPTTSTIGGTTSRCLVSHSLGVTPTSIVVTSAQSNARTYSVVDRGVNNFTVEVRDGAGTLVGNGVNVAFDWLAMAAP
jgi:hypothetical protein